MKKSILLPLLVSASGLIIIGCFFKVMLWPPANILIGIGLLTELVCVPFVIVRLLKKRAR